MQAYSDMTKGQLKAEHQELLAEYQSYQRQGLSLNMSRGKPAPDQLDLSMPLLEALPADERPMDSGGEDARNYGQVFGIPEARQLMASLLGVSAVNVLAGGSSSLNLMFDTVARGMLFGFGGNPPQCRAAAASPARLRFLCPVPGYDRHFAVTAAFGFENVPIPMTSEGPDIGLVERMVNNDPSVKGIWCTPKYSNPSGVTYSDEVVSRLAALSPAAGDFRIYWDNAYLVHDLDPDDGDELLDLATACEAAGNPDIWLMFCSTSKISFAGSGISAMATSEANLAELESVMSLQTIGPDKLNQLRHVRWLESLGGGEGRGLEGVRVQMRRLAALLAPKFATVDEVLSMRLAGLGVAKWARPRGGYFISLDAMPGTAKRSVELASQAGVTLTDAGATWPGGFDPADSNIRIAPSYPSLEELRLASELLSVCLRLAAVERLLAGVEGGASQA
jgi:aspartate/methionine/tyrosine aminotransferase